MPMMRNPFRRSLVVTNGTAGYNDATETIDGDGSGGPKASLAMDIKIDETPNEFKMSVVNDGIYLPPSPPERKSFFARSFNVSSPTTAKRPSLVDEPFSISRESFDSYRRSFDISAKSPIASPTFPRQSLDARLPRIKQYESLDSQTTGDKTSDSDEEDQFDDVILEGDGGKPRRRGIFSFGASNASKNTSAQANHGFFFGGRKRGLSGQGAELRSMEDAKKEDEEN